MRILPIALHGFTLTIANFVALLTFAAAASLSGLSGAWYPIALVGIAVVVFLLGTWLIRCLLEGRLALQRSSEYPFVYIAALIWTPILFIPIHYIVQGYLPDFRHITVLLVQQAWANLLVLLIAGKLSALVRGLRQE